MARFSPLRRVAVLIGVMSVSAAADVPKPVDDAEAQQLLAEVAKAYQALPAYADEGELIVAISIDGKIEKQTTPLHLSLIRPNLLKIEAGAVTAASDGKTLTMSVAPTKRFTSVPAPKDLTVETFRTGALGSVLFGGLSNRPMLILLNLLVGETPVKTILTELDARPSHVQTVDADGQKWLTVRLDTEKGPDYRLVIHPTTKLLSRIEIIPESDNAGAVPGSKVTPERLEWTAGRITTDVSKEDLVAYKPPEGYGKIEPYEKVAAQTKDAPKHRVEDVVGSPSPDFSLTVMDAAGKFVTVTKADLAGKVVMIDFWATWCGPCLAELPEVQKMIEAYAKEKKDVVIIALSLDQRPSELREVRKLVEKTLEEKKITLDGNTVGKIALDPSGATGEAFQIEAFPTVILLDAKGIVQSAHVGYSKDVRAVLTKDIDTLLAGQTLAKPKGAAVKPKVDD